MLGVVVNDAERISYTQFLPTSSNLQSLQFGLWMSTEQTVKSVSPPCLK